jgi:diaminohydroxyphosphoribosylaminopyrimidine deaminase/5-amino-6-(5-phosphoribosylamino)uracil reductase
MKLSGQDLMQRALDLASLGHEWVSPNPMVGCVIEHHGKIIGEGFHHKYGGPHAEVLAINSVEDKSMLQEATVYVSLEPCSHFGKTPPCADLLIKHKVKKVVICNTDPNPLVSGRGISKLKEHGIEVENGLLEEKGKDLNRRFFKAKIKNQPYVVIKWAETADGFIALPNNQTLKISNTITDIKVHQWRSEEDAIWVGYHTVMSDNPSLTVRHWPEGPNPTKVVVDKYLTLPTTLKIFQNTAPLIVFNQLKESTEGHISYIKINTETTITDMLKILTENGINSVLVEGGTKLINSFFDEKNYDEIRIIKSDLIIKNGIDAPKIPSGIPLVETQNIKNDIISFYKR